MVLRMFRLIFVPHKAQREEQADSGGRTSARVIRLHDVVEGGQTGGQDLERDSDAMRCRSAIGIGDVVHGVAVHVWVGNAGWIV